MTQTWVQVPACGLAFTDSFTWTGLNSYVTQDSNRPGRIRVYSSSLAAVGTHAVTVGNTATVTSNSKYTGGSSQAFANAGGNTVGWTITIVNPCATTTLNTITVTGAGTSPYTKSVTDGTASTFTFVRPTTVAEDTNGIASVCGATSYTIHNDNAGGTFSYTASWAVISGPDGSGTYTMTIDTTADTSIISTEASVQLTMYIRATLDDYNTIKSDTLITITVNEATCNCAALAWDNPTTGVDVTSSVIFASTSTSDQVLVKPDANTGAQTTNPSFQKCYIGVSPPGCSSDGEVTAIQWVFNGATASKPSWITWPVTGDTDTNTDSSSRKTKIQIAPVDGTQKGTHSILATWTPTNGSAVTYTALTFAVGCKITSFTVAGAPGSDPTYEIFSQRSIISLAAVTYTQVPACGYTFTNSFGHTIPAGTAASIIFAGTNVIPSFEIYSNTGSHAATYAVSLTNTITIGAGQDQGATTSFTPSNVDLNIVVSNPCLTTTIQTITFDTTPVTLNDGTTTTSTFTEPTDGVDTANGLSKLCGAKVYTVTDNADNSALSGSWAIVRTSSTANKMELFVDSTLYPSTISADVVKTLRVTTTFADWGANAGSQSTIQVTISTLSCSCAAMAWSAPTTQTVTVNIDATLDLPVTQVGSDPYFPQPVADDSAKSTNAAFNACWEASTPCTTGGSYTDTNVKYDPGTGIVALPGGWL